MNNITTPLELKISLRPNTNKVYLGSVECQVNTTEVKTLCQSLADAVKILNENEEQIIAFEIKGSNEHLEKPKVQEVAQEELDLQQEEELESLDENRNYLNLDNIQ